MRLPLFAAVLLSTSAVLAVQSAVPLTERLRAGHPRMFFNSDTWPAIKARAEGKAKRHLDSLLKKAASYPAEPKCSGMEPVRFREIKTASGTHKTTAATPIKPVKDWGMEAAECALAWRFTHNPAYLEKAKRMLIASAAAYREAYRNGRSVNWYVKSRIMALCAYDWIWEALTPDERRSIIVPLVEHVEEAHPGRGKKKIIRRNGSGWKTGYYGVRSLQWYSGLAAYGDGFCDDLALRHLREGHGEFMKLLEYRAESAGDDGGLVSAVPGYSMGAYPHTHFNFFHTYLSAFGENISGKYPAMALFPNWIYRTWISSPGRPRFSGFGDDQHTQNMLSVRLLFEHMTQHIRFFKDVDPDAARLAATLRAKAPNRDIGKLSFPVYPFILDPESDGVRPFTDEELASDRCYARHFETLGQILMRSGWREDSTYCTFTAGATFRQHKHHDENNFTIYKHDFLALDSGSRGYETDYNLKYYYAQTVAHNCMLIHAPGEPLPKYWGITCKDAGNIGNYGGSDKNVPAEVLAFETNGDFSYIASDTTKSYGSKTSECVRQFVHILPDVFVVYDRVTASSPEFRKEWLLHTKDEPVTDGKLMRADCGKGRLFCQTLLPADASLGKTGGEGSEFTAHGRNWELDARFVRNAKAEAAKLGRGPYYGSWRLEVKPGKPRASDRFLHVLTATDTSVSAPARATLISSGNMDCVEILLPDAVRDGKKGSLRAFFGFNKDGKIGGAVKIHFREDGSQSEKTVLDRPLTDKVTPQRGIFTTSR